MGLGGLARFLHIPVEEDPDFLLLNNNSHVGKLQHLLSPPDIHALTHHIVYYANNKWTSRVILLGGKSFDCLGYFAFRL